MVKFHDAIAQAVLTACLLANSAYGITTVALSGGVFMNRYLLESTVRCLIDAGFQVALPRELPANDGGVSFGQAVVTAAQQGRGYPHI